MLAMSLANMVLLFWLGLTVLLNAERRTRALWLAGSGLMLGGAFFLSHSAILGQGFSSGNLGFRFWWRAGLSPAIILPFAWYMMMLWYTGFWQEPDSVLRRRQTPWFLLTVVLLFLGGIGFVIVANPFFRFAALVQLRTWAVTMAIGNIPIPALGYPLYTVLCMALALDALRHPGPAARVMGDLARNRARPWLAGTTFVLLLVALLVGWAILTIVPAARYSAGLYYLTRETLLTIGWFDLAISSLIAAATILLGQAIVAYEVFTGKSLPRGGLRRHWRNAVILAAGYGVVVGWSLTTAIQPLYSLLLTTLLMTLFYALLSWRSYAERERMIEQLRPFVASQRLYEQLLERTSGDPAAPPAPDTLNPFRALCRTVLGTRLAYLAPSGPMAPLVGAALVYDERGEREAPPAFPWLGDLLATFTSPQSASVPLEPTRHDGAQWAVPLWSERGLIGVLLLGEKRDGGLYTQEEIEVARASGERLIDSQASAEMARRLMALQRQHLRESQLLDRRARRVLHDDVLPSLHAAMLTLSSGNGGNGAAAEAIGALTAVHRQLSDLLHDMPNSTTPEVARHGLVGALQEAIRDDLGRAFDGVTWEIEPAAARSAQALPALTAEVLFYAAREAIRNAARYARAPDGERPLTLRVAARQRDGLEVVIEDDGVGLEASARNPGGSGRGLALHSTMMAVVGGSLVTESAAGRYTRVRLLLPEGITARDGVGN